MRAAQRLHSASGCRPRCPVWRGRAPDHRADLLPEVSEAAVKARQKAVPALLSSRPGECPGDREQDRPGKGRRAGPGRGTRAARLAAAIALQVSAWTWQRRKLNKLCRASFPRPGLLVTHRPLRALPSSDTGPAGCSWLGSPAEKGGSQPGAHRTAAGVAHTPMDYPEPVSTEGAGPLDCSVQKLVIYFKLDNQSP